MGWRSRPCLRGVRRPRWADLAALIVMIATAVALVTSERRVGGTADEYGHLVRGLAFYWAPDTRLNWPHPPLAHAIAALPSVLTDPKIDFTKLSGWSQSDFTAVVRDLWERDYEGLRGQLVAGRRMMMGLLLVSAIHLFWFVRRRMGPRVAVAAVIAWCGYPALLAHGQLLTNDFAAGALALFVTTSLVAYLERRTWGAAACLGLACAGAAVTKHSLLLLVAASVAIMVGSALSRRRARLRSSAPEPRRLAELRRRAPHAVLVLAMVGLGICAAYRFNDTFLSVAQWNAKPTPANYLATRTKVRINHVRLPDWVRVPVPYTYAFGLSFVSAQSERGHAGYFMGDVGGASPAYFLILAGAKMPLGVATLLACGVIAAATRRRTLRWPRVRVVWISGLLLVLYNVALAASRINIGYRHATPTLAWIVLLTASSSSMLLRRATGWLRRGRRAAGAALLTLFGAAVGGIIAGAALAYPLYLGDFNVVAGGRTGGLRINVAEEDWGQDALDLGRWLRAEGATEVHYMSQFGTPRKELQFTGITPRKLDCDDWPEGYAAVHVSDMLERNPRCFPFRGLPTATVINDHVFVWKLEPRAPR